MERVPKSSWIRIIYAKRGLSRFLGHLDTVRTMLRALRRVDWPLTYTEGNSPRIKAAFSPALSTGFYSETEYMEVLLAGSETEYSIRRRAEDLARNLPCGLALVEIKLIPGVFKTRAILAVEYLVSDAPLVPPEEDIMNRLGSMVDNRGREFDLKEWLEDVEFVNGQLRLVIKMKNGTTPNPSDVVKNLLPYGSERSPLKFYRKRFLFEE